MKYLLFISFILLVFIGCSSDSSEEMEETIANLPTLSTAEIKEISQASATVGGTISDDGGATITERGVVWAITSNPTINDNKQTIGSGSGTFEVTLSNLDANTSYFIRAYAINSEGIAYGGQRQFTTLESGPIAKVFEGDVVLTSQQEVEDFGAENYTGVNGNLTIRDDNNPSTITDLTPLNTIINISESLTIENNNQLTRTDGFSQLIGIGGDLVIFNEEATFDIFGFNNLESVDGNLSLTSSFPGKIRDLDAFKGLVTIGSDMIITKVIGSVKAFGKLNRIGDNLSIQLVESIEDLAFFESLESIEGEFFLSFNNAITSLKGLEKLTELNGLNLLRNDLLSSLSGLENVKQIDGDLTVSLNHSLEDLSGLEGLEKVINGGVYINQNEGLLNLIGLNGLTVSEGGLEIESNGSLVNLVGLDNLRTMGNVDEDCFCVGEIVIGGNSNLENLNGLESLTTALYGGIEIENNPQLVNVDGLQNLETVVLSASDTGVFVNIEGNSMLDDFCGLKKLYESNNFFQVNFQIINNAVEGVNIGSAVENCE